MIHASCTGGDAKKSHNSPATSSSTVDQLHVTKTLPTHTHQLNNLISSDLTAAAAASANNNHLGVCKLGGSQSAQVVKVSLIIYQITNSLICLIIIRNRMVWRTWKP